MSKEPVKPHTFDFARIEGGIQFFSTHPSTPNLLGKGTVPDTSVAKNGVLVDFNIHYLNADGEPQASNVRAIQMFNETSSVMNLADIDGGQLEGIGRNIIHKLKEPLKRHIVLAIGLAASNQKKALEDEKTTVQTQPDRDDHPTALEDSEQSPPPLTLHTGGNTGDADRGNGDAVDPLRSPDTGESAGSD